MFQVTTLNRKTEEGPKGVKDAGVTGYWNPWGLNMIELTFLLEISINLLTKSRIPTFELEGRERKHMGLCLGKLEGDVNGPVVNQHSSPRPHNLQDASVSPPDGTLIPVERPQLEVDSVSKRRLSKVNPKSVPDVPFKNQIVEAYVYDVHDGDTVNFILDFGGEMLRLSLRMEGIDTPEIRAGEDRLPQEKIAATIARDYLRSLVRGYSKIKITAWDKYGGRCLGDIILPSGKTAVATLLEGGYGRPYQGEKKRKWTLEELTAAPFNVREIIDAVHDADDSTSPISETEVIIHRGADADL